MDTPVQERIRELCKGVVRKPSLQKYMREYINPLDRYNFLGGIVVGILMGEYDELPPYGQIVMELAGKL